MKEKIKNTKILEKTVGPDKAQILKRLGFAPRSQSFAFVALPQYAQSVRYPDSFTLRPSANPQVQDDMCGVQGNMGWFRCGFGALVPDKVISLFTSHLSRKFGFTLAEVLITLGIIGVVAAMTMPSLVQHYKKQAYSSKLKHFYSMMSQAVVMSEISNGPADSWDKPDTDDFTQTQADTVQYFNKYLQPYIKYIRTDTSSAKYGQELNVILANGTIVYMHNGSCFDMDIVLDNKEPVYGVNTYKFVICPLKAVNLAYTKKAVFQLIASLMKNLIPENNY